jgi:hypothetical protein
MALGERFRSLGASAILAGAFILLAASPLGRVSAPAGDELVWWALEQIGARPQATELEVQLLLTPEAGGDPEAVLGPRWGEARESGPKEGDGSHPTGQWRLTRRPLPDPAGKRSLPSSPVEGNRELLILRYHQAGRASLQPQAGEWMGREEARVYRLYRARIPGVPPGLVLALKARRLAALLGGRVLEGLHQPGLVSLSGYSPLLGPGRQELGGRELNFQLALRVSREGDCTWVVVGLPLIPGSF